MRIVRGEEGQGLHRWVGETFNVRLARVRGLEHDLCNIVVWSVPQVKTPHHFGATRPLCCGRRTVLPYAAMWRNGAAVRIPEDAGDVVDGRLSRVDQDFQPQLQRAKETRLLQEAGFL
jgi:hypothetical protein